MLFLTIYMVLGGLLIGNFVMEFINDGGAKVSSCLLLCPLLCYHKGQDIEIRKWIWQHYGASAALLTEAQSLWMQYSTARDANSGTSYRATYTMFQAGIRKTCKQRGRAGIKQPDEGCRMPHLDSLLYARKCTRALACARGFASLAYTTCDMHLNLSVSRRRGPMGTVPGCRLGG